MNDIDIKVPMKRAEFESMVSPIVSRLLLTVQAALDEAKLTADKLTTVEIVGGATRLGPLQKGLSDYLKKDVSKSLNPEEGVAKGCALQCAMLTPYFKVKEVSINDIQNYPVQVMWKGIGQDPQSVPKDDIVDILAKGDPLPSKIKLLSFTRSEPFEVVAEYKVDQCKQSSLDGKAPVFGLDPNVTKVVARAVVPSLGNATLPAQFQVKVKLNQNGFVQFDGVQLIETIEEMDSAPTTPATTTPATTTTTTTPASNEGKTESTPTEAQPMDTTAPTTTTENNATVQEPAKKKKIRRTDVSFTESSFSLTTKSLQNLTEEELKLQSEDRLLIETAEKKCALESLIYDLRDKLKDKHFASFGNPQDIQKVEKIMDVTLSWLYDEGAEATKSVYQGKIDEIRAIGDPIMQRRSESDEDTLLSIA